MTGWLRDLILGARLSRAGGREGWTRLLMTAVGVGLGVALLLTAASIPAMLQARQARTDARADFLSTAQTASTETILVARVDTVFRQNPIRGRVLDAEGPLAPVPPGLTTLPRPGEMIVSPALADLLAAPRGALLRDRLPYPVAGTIADEGLSGPGELAFYLGSDSLTEGLGTVTRLDRFGFNDESEGLGPILTLLVLIIFLVLLLPVAVFIGAAVRFGGEQRDRRLAALRLIGTDAGMTRRVAAGEVMVAAVAGVGVGLLMFYAGRGLAERVALWNLSVYGADLRPSPLLVTLILLIVPAAAVGVTILALRATVIEPLGVVRRSGQVRRRLWWRLVLPLVGLALLAPVMIGGLDESGSTFNEYQVATGVLLLLIGVTALLPWLIDNVVSRLRGGSVSIQLAVRRLQLHSATSARVVNGIAVAAAGAIALQMLFTGVQGQYTQPTGQDPTQAQAVVTTYAAVNGGRVEQITEKFNATAGVRVLAAYAGIQITSAADPQSQDGWHLLVAPCEALRERAVLPSCTDGDAFVVSSQPGGTSAGMPEPGQRVLIGAYDEPDRPGWTVPVTTRAVPARTGPEGGLTDALFATPGALSAGGVDPRQLRNPYIVTYLALDPTMTDGVEQLRNATAAVDPLADLTILRAEVEANRFANIRRGLYIGVVATLLLIGASMLVTMLEQLRDRRRLLAALVAFGTRRTALGASVLWQTAIPVGLGMALATAIGVGLGAALQTMVGLPVHLDAWSIVTIAGAAAAVVLLVTVLSLPAMWRSMRPEGLRAE